MQVLGGGGESPGTTRWREEGGAEMGDIGCYRGENSAGILVGGGGESPVLIMG